ncbi:MAG: arsenate reductase (glutaredoxin) [Gammaproteobacteria bacterium]|nr:arsenate reductase (glutaredoxin) [Gammaproteobacteria bacterium]NBT43859.1 arsenate reductase (glutaredoxin) [Gammaproteobacteria bacterium]NBY22450.1 arsenate reductase (glutaredoxin) [Gammaproteobacteria bacterium]NDE34016.1 arsenate reductase (glutaredoxin) [Gammaproteobacteria bacterium]NDE55954.1 arsenate reductase (glutaredoxin) [Gammaproteobacteria bacterium]
MSTTLYHNPRCMKSREALELLRRQGIEPQIREYLKDPPDSETLISLLQQLRISPRALLRTKELPYKELNLNDKNLTDQTLIEAMVQHPILIERPIFIHQDQAVIGRPPEQVLSIL